MGSVNDLRVTVFSSGSTVLYEQALDHAQDIRFTTFYPGGLFGEAEFTIKRDITRSWQLAAHQRVKIYNGLTCVWEGEIIAISYGPEGHTVRCLGYWSTILMFRKWRKPWADNRLDEGIWVWDIAGATAEDKCDLDRTNRIRFVPKDVAWLNNEYARVSYYAPTGEHIKRVTFSYDLAEGAQQWTVRLADATNSVTDWSVSATGSGTADIAMSNPNTCAQVCFDFVSNAGQTPASDGTIYGEVSGVIVYTETGNINAYEIANYVRARASELSTSTTYLSSSLNYALVPFISEVDTLADILTRAASFGDASLNSLAVGIRESDLSGDDKPVLFAEIQPALTGYDYTVTREEIPDAEFEQDITEIRNWIAAEYQTADGRTVWVTPDDDATLKDATSITAYGQIEEWLSVDTTDINVAKNACKRLLTQRKDPQWRCTGTINILAQITNSSGAKAPACRIRAGERIRVSNWLNDLSGTGLTFLITGTDYDGGSLVNSLTVGKPDLLAVWNARLEDKR